MKWLVTPPAAVAGIFVLGIWPASAAHASQPPAVSVAAPAATTLMWRVSYLPGIKNGIMTSITAPTKGAVWAVGSTVPAHGSGTPFLLRWNGRWRKSGMPVRGYQPAAIAASSAANVWMFGRTRSGAARALRWNGHRWRQLPEPGSVLFGLLGEAVLGPANVWLGAGGVADHWNGRSWNQLLMPAGFTLQHLSGTSPANIWVAGTTSNGRLAAYRWQHGGWRWVQMPHPVAKFAAILVQSGSSVWVDAQTLRYVLHWNGHEWRRLSGGGNPNQLPPAPYGRDGLWLTANELWTGRAWIQVPQVGTFPGVLPVEVASVPGASSAWMAADSVAGPVVLRTSG
jgi:hypothetical protein